MERFTISLDEELARACDGLIEQRGYRNRSEAVSIFCASIWNRRARRATTASIASPIFPTSINTMSAISPSD